MNFEDRRIIGRETV